MGDNPRARCDSSCPRYNEQINSPRLRGNGHSKARILLVGEAPGQNEDAQGRPFIGESGKLLRGMLDTVGISEKDIYITNAVKCATFAENQAPNQKTITYCRKYLAKEINKIRPNVIAVLGATALKAVLKRNGITRLKNNVFYSEEFDTKVVPIYHPAYILRNPGVLADFQKGLEVLQSEAGAAQVLRKPSIDANHYDADTPEKIDEVLGQLEAVDAFVFDLETSSLQFTEAKILCVALSWKAGLGITIKWDRFSKEQLQRFEQILCSKRFKINHNLKFDLEMLMGQDIKVRGPYFDTLLAASVIDENVREKGLDALTLQHLDIGEYWAALDLERDKICKARKIHKKAFSYDLFEYKLLADYAQWDADATFRLYKIFAPELEKQELSDYYKKYSIPTMQLLVDMEFHGVLVHRKRLRKLIDAYRQRLLDQSKSISDNPVVKKFEKTRRIEAKRKIALRWHASDILQSRYPEVRDYVQEYLREKNWRFNQKSVPQLSSLLFEQLHLEPIKFSKRTKKPSTDEESLRTYADQGVQLCQDIIEYRGLAKYIATYLVSTFDKSKNDGRIHANYLQAHTVTGRLCVDAATLITTDRGQIPICKLSDFPQAKALTHKNRFMPILNIWIKGFEEMFEVQTSDGHLITCTQNHRFLTPAGWKKLNELVNVPTIQNDKMVLRQHALSNDPNQTKLSTYLYRRTINQSRSKAEIPTDQQDNESLQGSLRRGIQRAACANQKVALLPSAPRQQARKKGPTENYHSQSGIGAVSRTGVSSLVDRRRIENFGMVCAREYAALQIDAAQQKAAEAHAGDRFFTAEKTGCASPWASGISSRLLPKSAPIFQKALRCVHACKQANLVCERVSKSARLLCREGHCSTKPHLLEHQQVRTATFNSIASEQNTSCSTIHARKTGEQLCLSSGFLLPQFEFTGRGGRRFPSKRRNNKAKGYTKGAADQETRLYSAPVYTFGCGEAPEQNGKSDQKATIVGIRSVGIREVWDIEVAEDHSYIAQGFINHNSCVAPNMQNIPRSAKDFKECLIADKGYVFIKADLKQAEFRCWAHCSDDEVMIKDIESGMDIHKRTAASVFQVAEEEVTDEQRTAAKAITFGLLMYGMGDKTAAKRNNLSIDQVTHLRKHFSAQYPTAVQWLKGQVAFAHEHGYVKTWLGRYRRLPELNSDDDVLVAKAEREATNAPIQGLASNMNDHFMVTGYKLARKHKIDCHPAVTQHDAQIFLVRKGQEKKMVKLMQYVVEHAFPGFRCKMVLDFEVGETLGTLEKYHG